MQVTGYACLGQFYDPDITTHGELWEWFLTPDGRGQLVAVGAQPQMIKSTPHHPHTQLCHWMEWSLGHFSVHSGPSVWDALPVIHFLFCL